MKEEFTVIHSSVRNERHGTWGHLGKHPASGGRDRSEGKAWGVVFWQERGNNAASLDNVSGLWAAGWSLVVWYWPWVIRAEEYCLLEGKSHQRRWLRV